MDLCIRFHQLLDEGSVMVVKHTYSLSGKSRELKARLGPVPTSPGQKLGFRSVWKEGEIGARPGEWEVDVFKALEEKATTSSGCYVQQSNGSERGDKDFTDKHKLAELTSAKPASEEMPKGVLQAELKGANSWCENTQTYKLIGKQV
ncbi:hypothetical protein STEG23_035963 [Scotinomys teguina]